MKTLKYFLFAGILGSSGLASANAFNINEHDAAVTGRGGASAATNTSPSSIVFNPGGIAVAEGTAVTLGLSLYLAHGSYEPPGKPEVNTDSDPAPVPQIYFTSRLHEKFAVGVGFHFPFGLAIAWPLGHPQADVIQHQALRTYFITPSVGFNLGSGLSIGGGLDIVPATVKLQRALLFGDAMGSVTLAGRATGIGARAGIMFNPESHKPLHLGVMWRSNVDLDFEGEGDFDIAQPFRQQLPPDGRITTSITLPQQVWGGVAYDAMPNLQLEYDAVWINWDKFKELRINLPAGQTSVSPENYRNTVSHRLGAEYRWPTLAVRAGFIYDPTPIPSTTLSAQLPDVDRKNVTAGGTYKLNDNLAFNLGVLWVTPGHRNTSNSTAVNPEFRADYGVQAFVASASVSGTFGALKPAPSSTTAISAR